MCYNLQSSIIAFAVAIASGILMMLRNTAFDRSVYPLVLAYSFVQLGEALMWYDTKCGPLNIAGGYIVYSSLVLQAVAMGMGLYLVNGSLVGVGVGLCFALYFLTAAPTMLCSKKRKGHMDWGFNPYFYIFTYSIICGIVYLTPITLSYRIATLTWFTFLVLYLFHKKYSIARIDLILLNHLSETSVGSLWCYFASLLSPVLFLIPYLLPASL